MRVTEDDLNAAIDEQLRALEDARDAVAAYRGGKMSDEERKAAMLKLEQADANLLDVRQLLGIQNVREAAKILGGEIVRGK